MTGDVTFEITDVTGEMSWRQTVPAEPGINRLWWNMAFGPSAAQIEQMSAQIRDGLAAFRAQATQAQISQIQALEGRLDGAAGDYVALQRHRRGPVPSWEETRSGSGQPSARGPAAQPGEYLVTMNFRGSTMKSRLVIRADPLLEG